MHENKPSGKRRRLSPTQLLFLFLYYAVARQLPCSQWRIVGPLSKKLRYLCCKHIFASIGKGVNIERGAYFGTGAQLHIGDYSGLGKYCRVPSNLIVGDYVMMGRHVVIYHVNHNFECQATPMMLQGMSAAQQTVIGDDVWLGERVMVMAGKNVGSHAIVGAGAIVSRDVPEWAIAVGNPAKVVKYRDGKTGENVTILHRPLRSHA